MYRRLNELNLIYWHSRIDESVYFKGLSKLPSPEEEDLRMVQMRTNFDILSKTLFLSSRSLSKAITDEYF